MKEVLCTAETVVSLLSLRLFFMVRIYLRVSLIVSRTFIKLIFLSLWELLFKFIHYCSAFSFIYSILALISSMTPASTKVMA